MGRVFVAAWPPPVVADQLADLPVPDVAGLRRTRKENLHVTLRFLGDVAVPAVVERARTAALPTATATLGPATARLGPQVVMVPVAGLDDLAAAVARATADLGRPPRHPFRGHVTLARARHDAAAAPATGVPVSGRFAVTEVAVVTSETRPEGARYTTVATVPCGPVRPHR